jgi:hypothetical protein
VNPRTHMMVFEKKLMGEQKVLLGHSAVCVLKEYV